jgi:hypothetical protein
MEESDAYFLDDDLLFDDVLGLLSEGIKFA